MHEPLEQRNLLTTFTTTSPTSEGALPSGVTEVGGVVLDLVGSSGARVVSQLSADDLFEGFFDNGSPQAYRGNPGTIGIQTGFSSAVVTALGGGLSEVAVRVSLYDGDTGNGDFDDDQNWLRLNGYEMGNFGSVSTEETSQDGLTHKSWGTGFRNVKVDTGFFYSTNSTFLSNLFSSINSTGQVEFELYDSDPYDNYFDFTQGVAGGLVDVGQPPNVAPLISSVTNSGPVPENSSVTVTITATDPDNTTGGLTYWFDFDNNGSYEVSNTTGVASHTCGDDGSYNVPVKVTDTRDGSDTDSTLVTVLNVDPTAEINDIAGGIGGGGGADPLKIAFWYANGEEDNYTGSIREYLEAQGHTVTYQNDWDGYVDVYTQYSDYDVVVVEHTCGLNTVTGLQEWFQAGKGYVALINWSMYTDPQDAYIRGLLNVNQDGLPPGESNSNDWAPADLYWADSTHPIANFPNSEFDITGIATSQYRDHVAIAGGTNTVEYAPGQAALVAGEGYESAGRVAYLGTNFHGSSRADPETRMLVENMIVWAAASAPVTAYEGDTLTFTGASDDPGLADDLTFNWNWGDSTTSAPVVPGDSTLRREVTTPHAYGDNGDYTVTLTVTDDDGGASSPVTAAISILNVAPTVNAGSDQAAPEGSPVSFSGSFTDPGWLDTHTIDWDFGDGATASGTLTPTHPYDDDGVYTATLTVTDNDGASDSDTLTVTVSSVAPTVEAGPNQTANEGQLVNFSGSFGDPGPADTHTMEWDFGDGNTADGTLTPTNVYADNGVYTVTLTVEDDDGGSDTDTMTVTVLNVAPTVDAGPDWTVDEGTLVELPPAAFSDPGFDGGGGGGGAGTYELTLEAFEDPSSYASCPWVFTWDGSQYVADNDVYSTARGAANEFTDYYTLSKPLIAQDGEYRLELRETEDEQSFTDRIQLVTVDHPAGMEVAADDNGNVWTYSEPLSPMSAVDNSGQDVLSQIAADDGAVWKAYDQDALVLDLLPLDTSGGATLVLKFRGFQDDGDPGDNTFARPKIEVQTQNAAGEWVTRNEFNPRENWATVAADLSGQLEESKLVRIVATSCHTGKYHAIDFVGLDTSDPAPIVVNTLSPVSASHSSSGDVVTALSTSDDQSVKLTVTDDDGGSVDSFFDVTVENVDPTIDDESLINTSPGCGDVVEGSPVEVAVSFSDPGFDNRAGGTSEHFTTSTIDWGDGTVESGADINVTIDETPGSEGVETTGTVSGSHVYEHGGVYTVTMTVRDDDGGVDTIETQVIITGAGIHDGVLLIIGTDRDDNVSVNQTGNGVIKVHAEFLPGDEDVKTFPLEEAERIWMVLFYGDDHASISGKVEKTAIIDGGPGNDHLNGGGGSNIVLGGLGDDMLIGGDQRDILIGGGASDRLVANPGQDILIGASTIYDSGPELGPFANDVALLELLNAWNNLDLDFAERQEYLENLYGTDLENILDDDDEEDVLTGASGENWFITSGDDTVTDDSSKGKGGGKKK